MYGSLVDADSSDYVRKEIWAVPVHKKIQADKRILNARATLQSKSRPPTEKRLRMARFPVQPLG